MMAWMCSTSGSTALRVCTMDSLQCGHRLARVFQCLLHANGRGPSGDIVASQHGVQREAAADAGRECRTELLPLAERQFLQLAVLSHAFLRRGGPSFMPQPK